MYRAADKRRIDVASAAAGVPFEASMEAAGVALADAACDAVAPGGRVVVLCGPGDNGGDGFVAAWHLHARGRRVAVLALPITRSRSPHASAAFDRCAATLHVETAAFETVRASTMHADLIVDALFGTGLTRPLTGTAASVVAATRASGVRILAADVPSGVMADAAEVPGEHVQAWRTVQFGGACLASVLSPARFAFGTWVVADVAHPAEALGDDADALRWTTDDDVRHGGPIPTPGAHKGQAGCVVVVAGSPPYAGAAALACNAAHRAGAGTVVLASSVDVPAAWPETIRVPIDPSHDAPFGSVLTAPTTRRASAWVIGPGLHEVDVHDLRTIVSGANAPIVVDAGALLPGLRDAVARHGSCWLTPHAGEAARLLEWPQDDVDADPIAAALRLAAVWRAGVVLKKAGAVLADATGRVRIVAGGHPGMASGGTGDALAGTIGAFLAQPTGDPLGRVAAACAVHARAGAVAGARFGLGLRASDLIESLPDARKAFGGAW